MKKILALLLTVLILAGAMPIYAQADTECEHEYFTSCDGVCMNCGEITREATHALTHIPAVEATDCQHPGNIEYYECSKCGGYFNDAEGYRQLNPWYIPITAECVRPEGAPDCTSVLCVICGEEIYGYGDHDLGDAFICQGGTCAKCGKYVMGYGCANDGPYCMDGHCIYCGEAVEGYGHENGAWAPCSVGECSYGCGLKYEPTAEHNDEDGNGICDVCWTCAGDHAFENGFDPCNGGYCSVCWTYVAGAHSYDNACDVDCNVCGENREVKHNLVHVDAVEGTCIETGNIEYWYCVVCGSAWLDAECQFPTNLKAVILVGPSHPKLIHYEAVEATCTEDGNIEYWYCELCGWAFLDEHGRFDEIRLEDTVIPAAHSYDNACDVDCNVCGENREVVHNVIHVEAKEPTCFESGNIEYWYCDICGAAWLDAECTLNTNLIAIMLPCPPPAIIHVEAKAPTCTENGNIEYWYCELCGYAWLDAECTLNTNLKAVILPAEHTFANPCDTYCIVCEEDVRDPAHALTYVPRVEAVDCQTPGNIEHWYCEVCGGYFNDAEGYNQLNPWYIPITADCVRPEGAPDCTIVLCVICGEEIYGYGDHYIGDAFICQGGTCAKCGEDVMGYGCANDGPYCMDGHCIYCGDVFEGYGHENGAWAPCSAGECAYGCGLKYEPTAEHNDEDGNGICDVCWSCAGEHTFEEGFYPCYGGTCLKCFAYVEKHDFEESFTVDIEPTEEAPGLKSRHCKHCSAVTDETKLPAIKIGDVNGDGRLSAKDLLALKKRMSSGSEVEIVEYNADIDGNGRINSLDIMRLKKLML